MNLRRVHVLGILPTHTKLTYIESHRVCSKVLRKEYVFLQAIANFVNCAKLSVLVVFRAPNELHGQAGKGAKSGKEANDVKKVVE